VHASSGAAAVLVPIWGGGATGQAAHLGLIRSRKSATSLEASSRCFSSSSSSLGAYWLLLLRAGAGVACRSRGVHAQGRAAASGHLIR
jgi:hypothetical protein